MNPQNLVRNADFALAAYANLAIADLAAQTTALRNAGFSQAQADKFAFNHSVVLPTFHDPISDLDVNVFKDANGELTVAIRGTLGTHDLLVTDAQIAAAGVGFDQIVAICNWWRRVSVVGQQVPQFQYVSGQPLSAAPVIATGELVAALAADPDRRVNVTGHSLGGHLAMAFNTLFSGAVSEVAAFNAPGFWESRAENQAFFAALGGYVPTEANSGNVTNVIADQATIGQVPFSGIAGLRSRPGADVDIAIENQWQSDEPQPETLGSGANHSIKILVDSLVVYSLLSQLSPALSTSEYKAILNQSVRGTAASYERVVDALEALFRANREWLSTGRGVRAEWAALGR